MAKTAYRLLSIYDGSDLSIRWQGGHESETTMAVNVTSLLALLNLFDRSKSDGLTFENVLFTTHGSPGTIYFDGDYLNKDGLFKWFADGHYETIFPFKTVKMYFDGCNVADGEWGWQFLEAAGQTFLRGYGGYVLGWTSAGFGLPSLFPDYGGHTVHPWGDVRVVSVNPAGDGGLDLKRSSDD
jgi:hypothetical protein